MAVRSLPMLMLVAGLATACGGESLFDDDAVANATATIVSPTAPLPASFPADVPVFPGARVVETLTPHAGDSTRTVLITALTPANPDEVREYYERELPRYDWSIMGIVDDDDSEIILFRSTEVVTHTGVITVSRFDGPGGEEESAIILQVGLVNETDSASGKSP